MLNEQKKSALPSIVLIIISITLSFFLPWFTFAVAFAAGLDSRSVPFADLLQSAGLHLISVPSMIFGVALGCYTIRQRINNNLDYSLWKQTLLYIIAIVNIVGAVTLSVFAVCADQILQPKYDTERRQQDEQRAANNKRVQAESDEYARVVEQAKLNGCQTDSTFASTSETARVSFYYQQVQAKTRGPASLSNTIIREREQSIRDCAAGRISPAEQPAVYARSTQQIIDAYKSMVSPELFDEAERSFKQKQLEYPSDRVY